MTQEEKAKAYDEAIEKARSLHDNYDSVSTLIDIKEELEHIFPLLAESEDERIRKALAEGLCDVTGELGWSDFGGIPIDEILSWLEKQGKKPAWSEEDEEMYQNIYECLKNGWRKLPTDLLKYESWIKSIKQIIGG